MTMRIDIKNADAGRTALVEIIDVGSDFRAAPVELAPGEVGAFTIHAGRLVRVFEKQDVPADVPVDASAPETSS